MKIEIKHKTSRQVLFSVESENIKSALVSAVSGGADLRGADLRGANLYGAKIKTTQKDTIISALKIIITD